jgi:uncharacterized phage protein (TIGR01671 family)
MREIKFRAWDKKTESMVEVMNLDYFTNSGCTKKSPSHLYVHEYSISFNGETDSLQYDDISDRFELMQYTGLNDKNGKEIYEWDILQWKFNNEDRLYKVLWDNGCGRWLVENINDTKDITHILHDSFTEIVGNIYENPELLKSTT